MDNEVDIWSGSHRDVHPVASGHDELANLYEVEAANLKAWDDKAAHGGVDFLPWWLNQVYWLDKINGSRTLDVFDIHAYPDADTTGMTDRDAATGLCKQSGPYRENSNLQAMLMYPRAFPGGPRRTEMESPISIPARIAARFIQFPNLQ